MRLRIRKFLNCHHCILTKSTDVREGIKLALVLRRDALAAYSRSPIITCRPSMRLSHVARLWFVVANSRGFTRFAAVQVFLKDRNQGEFARTIWRERLYHPHKLPLIHR
jgi:hypothetical protein